MYVNASRSKAEEVDRPLTGGPNPVESKEEQGLVTIMTDVYERMLKDTLLRVSRAMKSEVTAVDVPKWTQEMAELSQPLLFAPFKRGGDRALSEIPTSAQELSVQRELIKRFELPEWVEAPEVLEAIRVQSFTFSAEVVGHIEEDVEDIIRTILAENVGASAAVVQRAIMEHFDVLLEGADALRIARTETARAVTRGSIEAWNQTGVVTAKEWDASDDSCPFCAEMDGRTIGTGEPYWDKGQEMTVEFEGRNIRLPMGLVVDGPPLHPNCRCALKPVVDV